MRWVRVWLACVALVYPLYWAFASLVLRGCRNERPGGLLGRREAGRTAA